MVLDGRSPLVVRRIVLDGAVVWLEAEAVSEAARCPTCGAETRQRHDRYRRRPLDLPWNGHVVRMLVTVRRFACGTVACAGRTFAEDLGEAIPWRAQRTGEATALLLTVARAAGGEAGARLATAIGVPTSPDTLLRLLRQAGVGSVPTPRVLGVDDLALRKGRTYATLLVDMETRRAIDMLVGRDAQALAAWLRAHPGVEVIVRDRAGAYAEGARRGAPAAQQVADRFHLVQNASLALVDLLHGRRRQVEYAEPAPPLVAEPPPAEPPETARLSPSARMQAARRAARVDRWEEVLARHAAGQSLRQIAREMPLARETVHRLVRTPLPPKNLRTAPPRPAGLTSPTLHPYVSYLQDRWQAGCTNIAQLYREIVPMGYGASRSLLHAALTAWRPPRPPRAARGTATHAKRRRRFSTRALCLRPPDRLGPEERTALDALLAGDAELATGHDLVQRFRALIAARDLPALDVWLTDARASGLAPFQGMANGIAADRAAVEAGLTTPWSTGPVEGHVHRVKLLKRQGYGRAALDLLRARVVAA
ncbi:MAG TPA: ISL3 family transposase [Solirubrobacteraceae bacterium]|nr:ISL3 family transposase [Solirubrobacteraceae bacterium]